MCDCRILQLLILTITSSFLPLAESLSGDHVCTRVQNHTLTSRESYMEPVIVQTFTWCLQVPPRCPKTRLENRERYRIKTTVEERKISECCDGYVLQKLDGGEKPDLKCIPFCKSCENGVCSKPNICQCLPGYQGDSCTHECPPGSWGRECMQQCDCASVGSCNPVTGICECPPGWRGPRCKLPCSTGRWGLRCESTCDCRGKYMACHPETGKCLIRRTWDAEIAPSRNWTKGDLFRGDHVSDLGVGSSTLPTTVTKEVDGGTETTVSNTHVDPSTPAVTGFSSTRFSKTTEHANDDIIQAVSEIPDDLDVLKPGFPVPDFAELTSTTSFEDLTEFGETISQTIRKAELAITPRLSDELFYRNENNEVESEDKTVGPPHPSYVKTVQKEQVPQIPHDTTVLIVVGSVVSLCLTTLAALMVFYLRSKVFESVPLSIYSSDKNDGAGQERENTLRTLKITSTTLPPLPTFVNPVFAANPETALITFDAAELNKHYDNRTGTISIRVSGNIRDLLESHYDRPPAATCRHTIEQNTEHVYDEIPLTSPLCIRKES